MIAPPPHRFRYITADERGPAGSRWRARHSRRSNPQLDRQPGALGAGTPVVNRTAVVFPTPYSERGVLLREHRRDLSISSFSSCPGNKPQWGWNRAAAFPCTGDFQIVAPVRARSLRAISLAISSASFLLGCPVIERRPGSSSNCTKVDTRIS